MREFIKHLKALLGGSDEKDLMALQHYISKPKVLKRICIIIAAAVILLGNYLLNIFIQIPNIFSEEQTISYGILNFFKFHLIDHFGFYIVLLILIAVIDGRFYYLARIAFKDNNVGQKGDSRFATDKEIDQQYPKVHRTDGIAKGYGGIPVRYAPETEEFYFDPECRNNVVVGMPRSGKGQIILLPMIDIKTRSEGQPSLIINDPKLEQAELCYDTCIERGYEVHVLNLVDPENSMGYNALQEITNLIKAGNQSQAELLCRSFCTDFYSNASSNQDPFWRQNAATLLSALILAHIEDCIEMKDEKSITLYSVVNLFAELSQRKIQNSDDTALDIYFKSRPTGNRAKILYTGASVSGDRTKGGIYSSMYTELSTFAIESIARMTAKSTVDFKSIGFGEKPVAIFLAVPDYDTSNHFIATLFIKQLYRTLAYEATLSGIDGKLPRQVDFILDEFGNMPIIDEIVHMLTVCPGRGITFTLALQSLDQLKKYREDEKGILEGCSNIVYIQANGKDTPEMFSGILGNQTVTNVTRMGGHLDVTKNYTEMQEDQPLLFAAQLREFLPGENVILRKKRIDEKGNPFRPRPILNAGKNAFPYHYTYNTKNFQRTKISELPINEIGNIDPNNYVMNINEYFRRKTSDEDEEQIPDKYIYLADLPHLVKDLETVFISKSAEDMMKMSIYEVKELLNVHFENNDITSAVYNALLEKIERNCNEIRGE